MPRRPGDGLSISVRARLASAGALLLAFQSSWFLAGCQSSVGDAGCQLTQVTVLPGSPLTLLPDARLERVGDGFVLIGSDGATVRWASLTATGVLGPERSLTLPPGATSPRFAVAGTTTAGDRVLVAYLTPAANQFDAELHVIAATADGSEPGVPGPALVTFVEGATVDPPLVELGSSGNGKAMTAGLAWFDRQAGAIRFVTLDGAGQMLGEPTTGESGAAFSCLDFSGGKGDVTFTYNRYLDDAPRPPSNFISEAQENGHVDNVLRLSVAQTRESLTCSVVAPTTKGYAMAWQDYSGSWLAIAERKTDEPDAGATVPGYKVISYPFGSATDFGGPDLQPPLRGLAQFGTDYGVILAKPHAVELWRLDGFGVRQDGALVFPSLMGNLGEISVVQVGSALVGSYADYTDTDGTAGRRLFVTATCH